MPAYVLMKAFENAPARYDRAMQLLTLGRIGRLKNDLASRVGSTRGARVLELGCGAGSLAVMMASSGARVVAIDASDAMLEVARENVKAAGVGDRVEVRRLSVMEIDSLPARSFDFVVTTLVLSELSDDEIAFVLTQAKRLLAAGGRIVIADESLPRTRLRRIGFGLLRFPLQLLTYLATQLQALTGSWPRRVLYFAIEAPLMLLVFFFVPPTSRPLANIEELVERAGFRIEDCAEYLGGTLRCVEGGTV